MGPYPTSPTWRGAHPCSTAALEALVRGGACDGFGRRRRELLWELGLATRPRSVEGTHGDGEAAAARRSGPPRRPRPCPI